METELTNIHRLGFILDEVFLLENLLEVYLATGNWSRVLEPLFRLTHIATRGGLRDYEARALKISAQKAAYEHDPETAIALFTQSRDIAQIISHKLLELFIELAWTEMYRQCEQKEQATHHLNQVERLLNTIASNITDSDLKASFPKSVWPKD